MNLNTYVSCYFCSESLHPASVSFHIADAHTSQVSSLLPYHGDDVESTVAWIIDQCQPTDNVPVHKDTDRQLPTPEVTALDIYGVTERGINAVVPTDSGSGGLYSPSDVALIYQKIGEKCGWPLNVDAFVVSFGLMAFYTNASAVSKERGMVTLVGVPSAVPGSSLAISRPPKLAVVWDNVISWCTEALQPRGLSFVVRRLATTLYPVYYSTRNAEGYSQLNRFGTKFTTRITVDPKLWYLTCSFVHGVKLTDAEVAVVVRHVKDTGIIDAAPKENEQSIAPMSVEDAATKRQYQEALGLKNENYPY